MTLSELLPAVKSLSRLEKCRLAEFLSRDLAGSESPSTTLSDPRFDVVSPWNEHEAAEALQRFVETSKRPS